jgi:hypothetical protein
MKVLGRFFLMSLIFTSLCVPSASALTVRTSFMGGAPPANAAGAGNLVDIVNAAARHWEAAYTDPVTITIYFGWAPTGDAGTHTMVEQGGVPNREITGIILFDNSGAAKFYLDPTPGFNEEFQRRKDEYQDLGGGMVNVARLYDNPVGEAVGRIDLVSVAVHEIGHAMGLCAANSSFLQQAVTGMINITGDLPFAGTRIPLASNRAGITSHIDVLRVAYGPVMAGIGADERRLPSALDILANAEISGFSLVNLDPEHESQSRDMPARSNGRLETVVPARRASK